MAPTVSKVLAGSKTSGLTTTDGLVFPYSAGKVQSCSSIYNRVFKPMLVENGITYENGEAKFGIHALRHPAASRFIERSGAGTQRKSRCTLATLRST